MAQCLVCYFLAMLFHIERKWLLMKNLARILALKPKLSGNLQCFNATDRSIKRLKNSWISKRFELKWKIVKHFMRPKQRGALRKLFSLPPTHSSSDKILLHLWNKNFLTEKCRNTQIFAIKELQECSSWASRNVTVQMFFLTPNKNMFAGKFAKSFQCSKSFQIFNVNQV